MSPRAPVVFVTVGTDHHPFDRVVGWADDWSAAHPEAEVVVQYGTSRPPSHATGHQLLSSAEFAAMLARADAVVCAGGPGGIMESRGAGVRPIVVARRSDLGEHVDDHQRAFAAFMAARDAVLLADDESTVVAALDAVVIDRDAHRIAPDGGGATGIARIGELIDGLVREGRR